MAEKTRLMLPVICNRADDLAPALNRLHERGQLTHNQAAAILMVSTAHQPVTVALYQRTPKGTTYVHFGSELAYTVNENARVRAFGGSKPIAPIDLASRANYGFSQLRPGESLTVTGTELTKARGAAYRAAQYYGWQITTSKTPDGLKVSRIT